MTEVEHQNVRLDLASLVPLFFVVGFGAGILFIPLSLLEFHGQGVIWIVAAIIFTPVVNGMASVIVLFCGFPIYVFIARKRSGYTVRLVRMDRGGSQQSAQPIE